MLRSFSYFITLQLTNTVLPNVNKKTDMKQLHSLIGSYYDTIINSKQLNRNQSGNKGDRLLLNLTGTSGQKLFSISVAKE